MDPRDADASRFAGEAMAHGEPTGWFEPLYAAASGGQAVVPWDFPVPHALLPEWERDVDGSGRSALVVGCGYGRDAEFLASLGFRTTAFDISETAIREARERHAGFGRRDQVCGLVLDEPSHARSLQHDRVRSRRVVS